MIYNIYDNKKEYNIDFIISEITEIINQNIYTMLRNDKYLRELKSYCYICYEEDIHLRYTDNEVLMHLVREAIEELNNVDFLYDFRNIE